MLCKSTTHSCCTCCMLLRNQASRCNSILQLLKAVLPQNAGLSVHVFGSICPFDLYALLKCASRSNHVSNFQIFICMPDLFKCMIVNYTQKVIINLSDKKYVQKIPNYYRTADAIRNQKASLPINKLLPMNGPNKGSFSAPS